MKKEIKISKEELKHYEDSGKMMEEGSISEMGFGKIHKGRPPLTYEELHMVSVKLPESVLKKIDKKSKNRSEFIREAVYKALA